MIYGFIYHCKYIPVNQWGHINYLKNLHVIQELLDCDDIDSLHTDYVYNAGYACGYIRVVTLIDTIYYEGMSYYLNQNKEFLIELADSANMDYKFKSMDEEVFEQYPLHFLGYEV